jgi:hypothetical protein
MPVADAGTDAPPPCPADPPADGASCTSPMTCHWLRCGAAGAVTAQCTGAQWNVSAEPCPIDCGGACRDGQICAIFQSGSLRYECVDDPCAGGPLGQCMCDVCPETGEGRCAVSEFTVTCSVSCGAPICA